MVLRERRAPAPSGYPTPVYFLADSLYVVNVTDQINVAAKIGFSSGAEGWERWLLSLYWVTFQDYLAARALRNE